jgi:biopolymer transport protein TolR
MDHGELPEVQLRADERVPYGKVVEVMGLAQQAGMNRIGFVTERKQPVSAP